MNILWLGEIYPVLLYKKKFNVDSIILWYNNNGTWYELEDEIIDTDYPDEVVECGDPLRGHKERTEQCQGKGQISNLYKTGLRIRFTIWSDSPDPFLVKVYKKVIGTGMFLSA